MGSFSVTSKAVILVTIYIVLCIQNKTFVDGVQKYFISHCVKNVQIRSFFGL